MKISTTAKCLAPFLHYRARQTRNTIRGPVSGGRPLFCTLIPSAHSTAFFVFLSRLCEGARGTILPSPTRFESKSFRARFRPKISSPAPNVHRITHQSKAKYGLKPPDEALVPQTTAQNRSQV